LDCIPCFFKQALEAGRIAGFSVQKQKKILDKLAEIIPTMSLNSSPPEMGRVIYRLVNKYSGEKDIYASIKKKSNKLALNISVELAIAGNIIDYGVKNTLDVDKELKKILLDENNKLKNNNNSNFNFKMFKNVLTEARTILYLGDNAGETVFDRILIEEIKNIDNNKKIIYAVKEKPVINDALIEDAYVSGIDKTAEVISSGSDAPGTVLYLCSKKFLKQFNAAEMIISKGQGNYEALSQAQRPVFFLFMAKCPVIAKNARCNIGDINLLYHSGKKN